MRRPKIDADGARSAKRRRPRSGSPEAVGTSARTISEACDPTDRDNQAELKRALQEEKDASKLERLAAALLGRLLGVPIAVASAGFQHGGDGGPAGRQGRRFRLEAKKYADTTRLSDRELLGEIDHALARDEALEAWTLVATKDPASAPAVPGALVTAWLQTQNIAEGHRKEVAGLAADLREALLDAVEHSRGPAQAAARLCAVNALRAIPRTDAAAT